MTGVPVVLAAFLRRDWALARSYRLQFALELLNTALSLTLFFYLSRLVDRSGAGARTGLREGYFGFIVIGLALLAVGQAALTSFAERFREDQTTGTLEALMATPAPSWLVVLGSASYELLRAIFSGVLTVVLAIIVFGLRLSTDPLSLVVLTASLASLIVLFASIGIALAGVTIVYKKVTAFFGLATLAIAIFAGVYFPADVLPPVLAAISRAFPFAWGLDLLRASLLGGHIVAWKLAALVAASIVAPPLALLVFKRMLDAARRAGSLAQY